jgi:hypothetical protein
VAKQPQQEADQSSRPKVKEEWNSVCLHEKKTDTFTLTFNSKVHYKTSPEVVTQQPLIQHHVTTMQFVPQEYMVSISDAIVKIHAYLLF